jgi:hypothetical protein
MTIPCENNNELTLNYYNQVARLLSYVAGECSCERCEHYRVLADIVINEPELISNSPF